MKKIRKKLIVVMLMMLSTPVMFAQEVKKLEFEKDPLPTEKVIGSITNNESGGILWNRDKVIVTTGEYDQRKYYNKEQLYERLKGAAENKYKEQYPKFSLRNFKYTRDRTDMGNHDYYSYHCSALVVILDPIAAANENLSKALDKALIEVREGSRVAIDQIKVINGIDKEEYKDQVIEILLNKGFKVVAKEYLEKLYEEQQGQKSGIYNDRTTVKENNLSAVGYFMNVKLTETALRVQVINVSTGEYEGNTIIKLEK